VLWVLKQGRKAFVSPIKRLVWSKSAHRPTDRGSGYRRPLHTVPLYPPDFLIHPERLIFDYVEKEVKVGRFPEQKKRIRCCISTNCFTSRLLSVPWSADLGFRFIKSLQPR
uniref:Uncharacterized protein n=1 Tax=Oryzias sinensis TaxID=183150 RepID=A0A8C7Y018_9TELE